MRFTEFSDLREVLETTRRARCAVPPSGRLADDILFIENAEEPLVIGTYDNDLSVLNGVEMPPAPVTSARGILNLPKNKYGRSFEFITLYKALVGTHLTIPRRPGSGRQRG